MLAKTSATFTFSSNHAIKLLADRFYNFSFTYFNPISSKRHVLAVWKYVENGTLVSGIILGRKYLQTMMKFCFWDICFSLFSLSWISLIITLYVHEHDRLDFGMLTVETAVFDCIYWFNPSGDRKGQSYPVEYYLELVEEYSKSKIHMSEPELEFVYDERASDCKCLLIFELPA